MKYKTQIKVAACALIFMMNSIIGMQDLADILMELKMEKQQDTVEQKSKKRCDEIPQEFQEKLDPRYLQSLSSSAEQIIMRRQGFLSTVLSFSIASCCIGIENIRDCNSASFFCNEETDKKAP